MAIIVIRQSEDKLSQKRYAFHLLNDHTKINIVFDLYFDESRPTTRHKFRTEPKQRWGRLNNRKNQMVLRPDVPDDVKDEALREAVKLIKTDF
jgi:hypothetical protein